MWYGTRSNHDKGMCKELLMKYKIIAIFAVLITATSVYPLDDYTSQNFMFTRSIFDSVGIEQASWHDMVYQKQKNGFAIQAYAIYGQTFSELNNASYFLLNYKNKVNLEAGTPSRFATSGGSLKIPLQLDTPKENQINVQSFDRDILGQWLGINDIGNQYLMSLNPRQRQATIMFECSQDLNKLFHMNFFDAWSIDFTLPIGWVENNIGFSGDQKVLDAFNNPKFDFSKISPCNMSLTTAAQATIALTTKYISEPDTHVTTSTGIIIPFIQQNTNCYLFQPLLGFNAHLGLTNITSIQFPICKKHEYAQSRILFFFDICNNFLARNHQLRTFDVKCKQFSRYMNLLDRTTNTLVPGMNVLTLRSRVEPFNIVNFATGFRFKYKESVGQIAYELWAHPSERVTPESKPGSHQPFNYWHEGRYGFPFIDVNGNLAQINNTNGVVEPLPLGELGQTASESTINHVAFPDGENVCCAGGSSFVPKNKYISFKDLDHFSCAGQATVTHRATASVGFAEKGKRRDYFTNFGLFIEAAQNNAAMCCWGGWLKAGLSF